MAPLSLLVATILSVSPEDLALADRRPPLLMWHAPDACPGRSAALELFSQYLGDQGTPSQHTIVVQLEEHEAEYRATVAIDAGSPRVITSPRCETLALAAVLVVAVALEPVAVAATLELPRSSPAAPPPAVELPSPELTPSPEPTPSPESGAPELELAVELGEPYGGTIRPTRGQDFTTNADAAQRSERRAPAPILRVRVTGGVGLQLTPRPSGALGLVSSLGFSRWRLELGLRGGLPHTIQYSDDPSLGGRFGLISGDLRGCPTPSVGPVSFPLCFGIEAGALFGQGVGVDLVGTPTAGWLALSGGAALSARLHPAIALFFGADALVALIRPGFHVGSREPLFFAPILGGRALLGLEFTLSPDSR